MKLYAASVWPDMVGRHKRRSERGRSSAATYNAQVQLSASHKEASNYPAAKALLIGLPCFNVIVSHDAQVTTS